MTTSTFTYPQNQYQPIYIYNYPESYIPIPSAPSMDNEFQTTAEYKQINQSTTSPLVQVDLNTSNYTKVYPSYQDNYTTTYIPIYYSTMQPYDNHHKIQNKKDNYYIYENHKRSDIFDLCFCTIL